MQIFVLGMHRSGTSALARLLNLMGAYFGGENVGTGRNEENRKGFWERRDVRLLNDTMLFNAGCDWDRVSNLDLDALDTRGALEQAAADIVLNMDAHRPWFMKEPRFCVLFPAWRSALEFPVCVHINRNPLEVAHSLKARNNIPIRAGLALWEFYNTRALASSHSLPRIFVEYEELLEKPGQTADRIHLALTTSGVQGLRRPHDQELLNFLDPALRKQRKSRRALRATATASQLQLYDLLRGATESTPVATPPLPQKCLDTLRDYERSIDLSSRVAKANARQRDRSEQNLELQLALKGLELTHASKSNQDLTARLHGLERQTTSRLLAETDLKIQSAVANQKVKTLEREVSVLERQRVELRRNYHVLDVQFKEQRGRNANLDGQIREQRQRNDNLDRQSKEQRERNDNLDGQIREQRQRNDNLDRQSKEQRERNDNLDGQIREQRQRNDNLDRQSKEQRERNDNLDGQIREQRQRNDNLDRQSKEQRERNDNLDRQIKEQRQRNDELKHRRDHLLKRHSDLEGRYNKLQQNNTDLRGERDRLRQRHADLEHQHRNLHRDRAELKHRYAKMQETQAELRAGIRDALENLSRRRSETLSIIKQWDARLAKLKARIAALSRLERQLTKTVEVLLGSRRWRVGDLVLTVGNRALMRSARNSIPDRLSESLAAYRAGRRSCRNFAAHLDSSTSLLVESMPYQSRTLEKLGAISTGRDEQLAAKLMRRSLQIDLRERELEALHSHIDCIVTIGKSLLKSRRWRIGQWLASVPYRLLFRPPPPTAAATLSRHIQDYRLDKSSLRAESTIDAPPVPGPVPEPHPALPAAESTDAEQTTIEAKGSHPQAQPGEAPRAVEAESPVPDTSVDIVVCVHNALDDVQRCLYSVTAKTTVAFRLILVNDGSNDETTRWLRRFAADFPTMELIETNGPLGYTRAANHGLRASGAEYVVLLNSDTIVPRLWLEGLLECVTSDENIGIAGSVSNAATWQSIPETINEQGGWAVNSLPTGYNVDEFSELVRLKSSRQFPRVDFVNGFCLMISRKVIDRIGYLDEESFPRGYGEENDYCLRARDAGIELAIADHCFIFHAKSKSFGSATRDSLAAQGRETLERKYGLERIRRGTERLRNARSLADLRQAVAESLTTTGAAVNAGANADSSQPRTAASPGTVLFVLPAKGGSGGANSVIQEVDGMRNLGIEAKAVTHQRYRDRFRHFYREFYDSGDYFLFFDTDDDLMTLSEPFDIIVATLWSTPAQIAPISRSWPDKVCMYYVQDYEPWFFPQDRDLQAEAAASYTLLPEMAMMAKTDWICRTVRERHGREVYRVAPSLDHEVYYTESRHEGDRSEGVTIAAMIRPSTPRRAPIRTLRVLREVTSRTREPVRVVIFGCEPAELHTHLKRHEPSLRLDFPVENRGLLTRNQVADLLREADIFLDLSDYQAFGRTGLEAMACGCATVLTAHGGGYEYALEGENCLLVDVTSSDDIVAAIERLIGNSDLRQRIQSNAMETAARYSILRASLSELSVFRLVSSLQRRKSKVAAASYRRGIEPVVAAPAAATISVLAAWGSNGYRHPFSSVESRVLRPLRHANLRNRLDIREASSLKVLDQQRPDICVVAGESVEQESMARQIIETCKQANIKLIYETDEQPDARDHAEAAVRLLAAAADRVIVSSRNLGEAYAGLNSAVKVLLAAIDESLWIELSVSGERLLGERRTPHATRLVCVSNGTGLAPVVECWPEILEAAQQPVSLQVVGGFEGAPGTGWEVVPDLNGALEDSVRRLRASNRWDVALLPADDNTPDADLRFLGYAALGLTIVCSDRGPHMNFARHAENAIVVGNSPSQWRDAIIQAAGDADLRNTLCARALYDVDTKYSLNRRALDFFNAYAGVLK